MKNFPHQFNDLEKFFGALESVQHLISEEISLSDDNFGSELTRRRIYTYRDKNLTIEQYLAKQQENTPSNRGYHTVARDTLRLFNLLGLVYIHPDKSATITSLGIQILSSSKSYRKELWREAFLRLRIEGTDGEISHPYLILIKLVRENPGIETKKLMLALEAENDSVEEYERVKSYIELPLDEILEITGTTLASARNAVKILPGVAEQLNDLRRSNNSAYPTQQINVDEDDISSYVEKVNGTSDRRNYREVTVDTIAIDPTFNPNPGVSVDLTSAILIRQERLALHQKIVRLLAELLTSKGYRIYEGKFDCLATRDSSLLFEVKTIKDVTVDQEKQTVKAVGQLQFYNYSIVRSQMNIDNAKKILLYSQKPDQFFVDFCSGVNIIVSWINNDDQFLAIDPISNETIPLIDLI